MASSNRRKKQNRAKAAARHAEARRRRAATATTSRWPNSSTSITPLTKRNDHTEADPAGLGLLEEELHAAGVTAEEIQAGARKLL